EPGPPVDPPDPPRTIYAHVVARTEPRRPIVPASVRSRDQRRVLYSWAVRYGLHTAVYHATRTPKYAAKVVLWAPVGAGRIIARTAGWVFDAENWRVRQQAADRGDADTYLRLVAASDRHVRARLAAVAAILAAITVTTALVVWLAPVWVQVAIAVATVLALARVGRPADRPILDRVTQAEQYRKLTAELVRRALMSCGIAAIKDPSQLVFPTEIHRDGPGHRAIVDLPYGVEAAEVIERRGRLASALRLPLDQVWPETHPGHTGRLAIWVGDQPASAMRQPPWPLLKAGQVDLFAPFPFATDPRLRPVNAAMMYRNWLFGGVPGSGKTFALRLLVLAASLDPRAEIRGYELKGTGDYDVL